jgi:hypothetical protein
VALAGFLGGGDGRLEGRHQVHDLLAGLDLGHLDESGLAGRLALDEVEDLHPVGVLEPLGGEVAAEGLDELLGHRQLLV